MSHAISNRSKDEDQLANANEDDIRHDDASKRAFFSQLGRKLDVQAEEAVWRGMKLVHRVMHDFVVVDGPGMDIMEFAFNFALLLKGISIGPYGRIRIKKELWEDQDAAINRITVIGTLWLLAMAAKSEIELSEDELRDLHLRVFLGGAHSAQNAKEMLQRAQSKVPQLRNGELRFWYPRSDEEFSVDRQGVIKTDGGFPDAPRKVLFDPAKHPELEAEFSEIRLLFKM